MRGALLDALFPAHCCLCGLPSRQPLPLCLACRRELPANRCRCHHCALPLPADHSTPGGQQGDRARCCGRCQTRPPPFTEVIAPWLYDEQLAFLISRWKYHREQRLTALLASLWLQAVPTPPAVDLLVPVPLHWRKLWQRGYNQATLLAVALRAGSPRLAACTIATRRIRRNRPTAAQSGMNAAARADNLRAAFTVERPCDNLRIAIVDDVLTTGATATALSRALLAAGAARVDVWCLARTAALGPARQ